MEDHAEGGPSHAMEVSDDSSGSSSSSSDDEGFEIEIDEEDLEKLLKLEEKLTHKPRSYQDHVQYISLLESNKLKKRLTLARQRMHELFPLPEDLWLSWLNDELEDVKEAEDIVNVLDLCQDAVNDYLSISLWKFYLEIAKDFDPEVQSHSEEGKAKFRELCEKALTAGGMHFTEGQQLWDLYRGWEADMLDSHLEVKAQEERVRKLFHRNLKVPFLGLQQLLQDYQDWEKTRQQEVPPHVVKACEKAQEAATLRQIYEETIAPSKAADSELLTAYMSYIKLETDSGEIARVQCLFERAVYIFPTCSGLWLKYVHHLESNAMPLALVCSVAHRASRNCHKNGHIWSLYLSLLELTGAGEEELREAYDEAVGAGMQNADDFLQVIISRACYLRRHTDLSNPVSLRSFLTAATTLLASHSAESPGSRLCLASYWTHCEAHVIKDVEAARKVWEAVVAGPLGRHPEAWQSYISMERSLRNIVEARNLYARVLGLKLDRAALSQFAEQWLEFEREDGSAEQQAAARVEVGAFMEEPKLLVGGRRGAEADGKLTGGKGGAEADGKLAGGKRGTTAGGKLAKAGGLEKMAKVGGLEKVAKSVKRKPEEREEEEDADAGSKRPRGLDFPDENAVIKRPKVVDPDQATEQVILDQDKPAQPLRDTVMQDAGPAVNKKKGGKALPLPPPPPRIIYTDSQTVYVRNLGSDVTEEELRELFKACGEIREVRIPRDKTGVPKGFAYVELQSDDQVAAAEQLHGTDFHGQHLFVKKSDPPKPAGGFRGRGRGEFSTGGPPGHHRDSNRPAGHHGDYSSNERGGADHGWRGGGRMGGNPRGRGGRGAPLQPTTRWSTGRPKEHLELGGTTAFLPRSVKQHKPGDPQTTEGGQSQPLLPARSNADFRKMMFGNK